MKYQDEITARTTEVLVETEFGSFMVNNSGRIRQVKFATIPRNLQNLTAEEFAASIRGRVQALT